MIRWPSLQRSPEIAPRRHLRGIALLSALICLVILSAVVLTLTQTVISRIREAESYQHQLQADALAESALGRARQQAAADAQWSGEVWTPEVPGQPALKAVIELQPAGNPTTLHVVCFVSTGTASAVRVERTFPWNSSSAPSGTTP